MSAYVARNSCGSPRELGVMSQGCLLSELPIRQAAKPLSKAEKIDKVECPSANFFKVDVIARLK